MSNTIARQWRHTNASSGDGTAYIYIDSKYGSNANGDGSMSKPWQTIEQAMWYCFTKRNAATTVYLADGYYPLQQSICDSSTSAFRMTLVGDTAFGATIDGLGEHILMRQGGYSNLRLIHMADEVGQPNTSLDTSGYTNEHGAFAGVGRASHAHSASGASSAYGFSSAPVLFESGKIFRGAVGGSSSNCVYSHVKRNSTTCGVTLYCYSGTLYSSTAYSCKYIDYNRARRKEQTGATSTGNAFHGEKWLFSNFDIFIDDGSQDSYNMCFFDADCEFIFANSSKQYAIKLRDKSATEKAYELSEDPIETKVVSGYGADRTMNLYACYVDGCERMDAAVNYLYTISGLISGTKPVFGSCVWSELHADEIFNNPEHSDFTLIPTCDAVDQATGDRYGYLSAARHISIFDDSDGKLNCFDNRTIDGCLSIQDGVLCVDDNQESKSGAIYSKILTIDPKVENLTAIYSVHENRGGDGVVLNQNPVFTETIYTAGIAMPAGTYMVTSGNLSYYDINGGLQAYKKGEVFIVTPEFVSSAMNVFTSSDNAEARYVKDPNQMDCVYIRLRGGIYHEMHVGDNLPKHCTYLNTGNKNVTYNNRTILPGESFVTTLSSLTFSTEDSDPDYTIGVVFDDRTPDELAAEGATQKLVSEASPFVPAQMFGEYFVYKNQGTMLETTDDFGTVVPQSSGNWRNFNTSGATTIVPAGAQGAKSVINQQYIQVAVFVNKV